MTRRMLDPDETIYGKCEENVRKTRETRTKYRMKTKMMKRFKDEGEDSLWKNNEYNVLQGYIVLAFFRTVCLYSTATSTETKARSLRTR